ncbi:MAG: primosomal protein N' [Bacilli bacterium]|nr:primosomal protein N' [Bacilli bacterium]
MYAQVLVELSVKTVDKPFTYIIPKELKRKIKIGIRVKVPFGKRIVEGFVVDILDSIDADYELKEIIEAVDIKPVLNDELLKLGQYISEKTLCYKIEAYQVMLPRALKAKLGQEIRVKEEVYVKLNEEYKNNNFKLSNRALEIIDYLLKNECVKKSELNKISISAVKTLLSKGIIKTINKEVYRLDNNSEYNYNRVKLTGEQLNVIKEVLKASNENNVFLLHGVTGSGKTEVYMELVDKVIKDGKEAIILVPEISLTPQMVNRFKSRFLNKVAILHSGLNSGEKYDEWRKIERKEVSIVIGARSAIFAPFENIGIIIIDEEHETTYKQENNPRYSAIDIAKERCRYHNCPLLLGSATPSLESYARARKGVYKLLSLPNRINKKPMPNVEIIDMKEEMKGGNRYFSRALINKINDRLDKNEQIILLLNRRGYSPYITCRNCGYTDKCPNCDITLTYHKNSNLMRCHYCGYGSKKILVCPSCNSKDINEYGVGTEKIEEEINSKFPKAKVVRMDVDTTSRKGAHEKILTAFRKEKYNILLGTQMIAKGLDFPKVTLVGVLNGDTSLNIPDFRSGERTFQLLSQVAGRAGRKDLSGEVIIQTFNPEHYSIKYASNHDYYSFYNEEMTIRRSLKYPPYYFITIVKIHSKDYNLGLEVSKKVGNYLKSNLNNNYIVLGPSTANIYRINNVYRFQCIVKYKNPNELIKVLKDLIGHYKNNRDVSIEIDVDPVRV